MGNINPSHAAAVHAYDPSLYIVNKPLEKKDNEREKYERDVKEYNLALKAYKERHPECNKPFITLDTRIVPAISSISDTKIDAITKRFGL